MRLHVSHPLLTGKKQNEWPSFVFTALYFGRVSDSLNTSNAQFTTLWTFSPKIAVQIKMEKKKTLSTDQTRIYFLLNSVSRRMGRTKGCMKARFTVYQHGAYESKWQIYRTSIIICSCIESMVRLKGTLSSKRPAC